ncbi:hypothetical protein [Salinithrix halophila]|uniref:Uncharacterized protein n=1 Tax=Salinithrix halophila TaxID=1485204 RepID=A0ABV8J9Q9_9BACL
MKNLQQFLERNRPEDPEVRKVWRYIIIMVECEEMDIHDLITEYHRYLKEEICGTQGIEFISNWDGTLQAGTGVDKTQCDETAFLNHFKSVIDQYVNQ